MKTRIYPSLLMIGILLGLAACQAVPADIPPEPSIPSAEVSPTAATPEDNPMGTTIQSSKTRQEAPAVPQSDLQTLSAGNTAFALDLFQQLKSKDGNLFYSPYSISEALAMTYAGARSSTASQMADVLHYTLPQEALHPAFNALDQELASRKSEPTEFSGSGFQLNIANSLWGQQGYAFEESFLDTLALNYGAGMRLVDYAQNSEAVRQEINNWVSQQTEQKIQDLVPPGALNSLTRLVLANAIYFKAAWASQFEASQTQIQPFTLLDGSPVQVPLMQQEEDFNYAEGSGWQAVELPYEGRQVSMLILLPEREQFSAFQDSLTPQKLDEILSSLADSQVILSFPQFEYDSEFALSQTLQALGMKDAFSTQADFTGMEPNGELFISEVLHKAYVKVNEEGTEAAAATAVVMEAKAMPMQKEPVEMRIDHPFIFLIRDNSTGTILFMGRVLDPTR